MLEGTHARKYKENDCFLWYFARLIVPLSDARRQAASQKNSNLFGFSFDLHYLCSHDWTYEPTDDGFDPAGGGGGHHPHRAAGGGGGDVELGQTTYPERADGCGGDPDRGPDLGPTVVRTGGYHAEHPTAAGGEGGE